MGIHLELNFIQPGVIPLWLDLGAVALGAIYGATLATSRNAPMIGVLLVSVLMGFGGSMLRDIMLNAPINALVHGRYMTTVMICTFVGAVAGQRLLRPQWLILMMDAVVMGLFTVIGAEKAYLFGMPASSVVFIGTITAIGGGIMSDILLGVRPDIMSRGPWSASIALLCAGWFVVVYHNGFHTVAEIGSVIIAVVLKGLVLWRKWEAPMPEHFTSVDWIRKRVD
jgi:uncharacterized membrane protein YeiH